MYDVSLSSLGISSSACSYGNIFLRKVSIPLLSWDPEKTRNSYFIRGLFTQYFEFLPVPYGKLLHTLLSESNPENLIFRKESQKSSYPWNYLEIVFLPPREIQTDIQSCQYHKSMKSKTNEIPFADFLFSL